MKHIAYIEGLTSSDRSAPKVVLDIALLDIGEADTIAMMDVRIPPGDYRSLEQFLHSEMLKFLTDAARSQAIAVGKIDLRNGHTDGELKDLLLKSSLKQDCISERPRPLRGRDERQS